MTHLWVRAEQRENEDRVGVTPQGVRELMNAGIKVTVEDSKSRIIPTAQYQDIGCEIAQENSWPTAPQDAIIFGLKELPDDGTVLPHRHIMFGHAFKGQYSGKRLLKRFKDGGGTLLDLEYLVDENNRRVAAFGYWAGFAGAAVTLKALFAQHSGAQCAPVHSYPNKDALICDLRLGMQSLRDDYPNAIVIGALGRVGTGATDLCRELGIAVTQWDISETAHGGPFPEILNHTLFFNCILARPETPVFIPKSAISENRRLRAIGDIACDPDSDYNPIPIYECATTWDAPALRVGTEPILDVVAIDNLPSLLPLESSQDFAEQLLPSLLKVGDLNTGVWARANHIFIKKLSEV